MKALLYDKDGSQESLEIRESEKPAPKKNEVLVGVHAVSIKDWDWGLVQNKGITRMIGGLFRSEKIIGSDIAGRVGQGWGRSETIPAGGCSVWRFEPLGRRLRRVCRVCVRPRERARTKAGMHDV